jgi:hypothetical protein
MQLEGKFTIVISVVPLLQHYPNGKDEPTINITRAIPFLERGRATTNHDQEKMFLPVRSRVALS